MDRRESVRQTRQKQNFDRVSFQFQFDFVDRDGRDHRTLSTVRLGRVRLSSDGRSFPSRSLSSQTRFVVQTMFFAAKFFFFFGHQGSSKRCVDFLLSLNEPVASTKESLTKLFNLNPSVDFALNIMKSSSTKYFQADEIVLLFLQVDQHLNGIRFVEELMNEPEFSSEKEQIDKLKTSFDLLKKYSFLVEEKVRPEEKENPIDDEYSEIHCTEKELAHRLTRRITRSALEKIRRTRRCSVSSVPTLERIDEDPRPFSPRTDSTRSIEKTLCHEDFFNDFPESLYFTDDVHLKTDENPSTD